MVFMGGLNLLIRQYSVGVTGLKWVINYSEDRFSRILVGWVTKRTY